MCCAKIDINVLYAFSKRFDPFGSNNVGSEPAVIQANDDLFAVQIL